MDLNSIIFSLFIIFFGYYLNKGTLFYFNKNKINLLIDNKFKKPQAFHEVSTYRLGGVIIYLLLVLVLIYLLDSSYSYLLFLLTILGTVSGFLFFLLPNLKFNMAGYFLYWVAESDWGSHYNSYGNYFKKTYLYENDTKSPLFKEKVLTMFWEDTDYLSKRYFRRYNIPYLNAYNLVIKRYVIIETLKYIFGIISIKNLYIFKSLQSFFLFYTFLLFRYRFIRSLNILNQLRQLKVIYVHYDTLFPQFFLLACDTKGITTISSQERTIGHEFFSPLFYCKYLTAGQGFHDIIKQR